MKSEWSRKLPLYVDKKDKRYNKHLKQLKTNGFSDSETWSLYYVIAKFVLPRLIRFRDIFACVPMGMTETEWKNILDTMIYSFTIDVNDECDYTQDYKRYNEGIKLFAKYYRDLWW